MSVRLYLFGAPRIECNGRSHSLPFERRNQLLVYLALKRAWVERAELAALLWPEQPNKLAFTNLRKTLFRLQSAPWAQCVELEGNAARVVAESDAADFEAAMRDGREADVLQIHSGETLLAGFDDGASAAWSDWIGFERERVRSAWRNAALDRLGGHLEPAQAIELSARLLAIDPLDEAALQAQMTALARSGQAAQARQAYRDFVARLAKDLALAPGAELKALHDALGKPAAAPSAPAAPRAAADRGFIGRTVELRRIAELLARDDCRLLCLIGPGGVGKTRLARRAADELAHDHADGAVFIPLEDIETSREIGSRLARELDMTLAGRDAPLEQIIEFLRRRRMLLVFDNFEHLQADASILDRLLGACPGLKIIATSRVRLALPSEWLLPLEGLPCPAVEDQDHVEAFDAARLFIQAARRVEPGLSPAVEAAAIVDICTQLEGHPLALELAAAWARALPCESIAAELRHGTELLRAGDAAHPARHASIEVVFDQSWRLLSEIERHALARLSVFRGGFTPEVARAVVGASLPVLGALTDKSLLRKEGKRLFMHSLVQQLAALRLGDGVTRAAAERAHAHYFHRLLDQGRRAVEHGEREALTQIDTEFENLRLAWAWAIAQRMTPALRRSLHTLSHYCDHRSRLEDGLVLLRDALAATPDPQDPAFEALLLGKIAHLEYRLDRYAAAIEAATRGLAIPQAATDADATSQCLKVLGTSHLRLGQFNEARRYFEEGLKLAPLTSDPRHAASMLSSLALVEKSLGNHDAALKLSLDALEQQRKLGDVASEALSLNNLAALHIELQQFEAAAEFLKPALALSERLGLNTTRVFVLANLSGVALKTGDYEGAEAYGRRGFEQAQAIGNRFVLSFLRFQFVRFALRRGDLATARAELRAGMELAIEVGRPSVLVEGVNCLTEVLVAQGELGCARAVATFVVGRPETPPLERAELERVLERMPSAPEPLPSWPGLSFEALVNRVVSESTLAYAPLIGLLRGQRESVQP